MLNAEFKIMSYQKYLIAVASIIAILFSCTKRLEETNILRVDVVSVGEDYNDQYDLSFTGMTDGMMIVDDWKLYKTMDGSATTWTNCYTAANFNREIEHLEYRAPGNAIIAVRNPSDLNRHTFYYTNDGGAVWYSGAYVGWIDAVSFYSATEGYYLGYSLMGNVNCLWYTNDGGLTWSPRDTNYNIQDQFQFLDYNRGFYLSGSYLYTTTNGGLSWQNISTDVIRFSDFQADGSSYAIRSSDRSILKTTDFGSTWTVVLENKSGIWLEDIDHHASGLVVASGNNGILVSQDHGATWKSASGPGDNFHASTFFEVEALDAKTFVTLGKYEQTNFIYRITIP